jgi:hypothetical protein
MWKVNSSLKPEPAIDIKQNFKVYTEICCAVQIAVSLVCSEIFVLNTDVVRIQNDRQKGISTVTQAGNNPVAGCFKHGIEPLGLLEGTNFTI